MRQLDGSGQLIVDLAEGLILEQVLQRRPSTVEDEADLARLRIGLDAIGLRRSRSPIV